jgi:hypothetical protein
MLSEEEIQYIRKDIAVVMGNYGYSNQVVRIVNALEKLIAEQDIPLISDDELKNYQFLAEDELLDEQAKE